MTHINEERIIISVDKLVDKPKWNFTDMLLVMPIPIADIHYVH